MNSNSVNIGVVGYSAQKFDEKLAREKLNDAFDKVVSENPEKEYYLFSGLTDLGIPGLAYKEAAKRNWHLVGIACKKAEKYQWAEIDEYDYYLIGGIGCFVHYYPTSTG